MKYVNDITFMKNVVTNEKYILRKMGLNFQSNKSNIYAK